MKKQYQSHINLTGQYIYLLYRSDKKIFKIGYSRSPHTRYKSECKQKGYNIIESVYCLEIYDIKVDEFLRFHMFGKKRVGRGDWYRLSHKNVDTMHQYLIEHEYMRDKKFLEWR